VKLLRIWLLVVLAVLLPVRGAMAATMSCGPAHAGSHGESAGEHHRAASGHEGVAHEHGVQAHGHAPHGHDGGGPSDHDHASQDQCTMCSASCSTPPLPSAVAGLDEPLAPTSASFPDLHAPVPTFQSDGQERPPRTL